MLYLSSVILEIIIKYFIKLYLTNLLYYAIISYIAYIIYISIVSKRIEKGL
nr:MAG TPA: hypothetical protein [Caudoviricetes sp.]